MHYVTALNAAFHLETNNGPFKLQNVSASSLQQDPEAGQKSLLSKQNGPRHLYSAATQLELLLEQVSDRMQTLQTEYMD